MELKDVILSTLAEIEELASPATMPEESPLPKAELPPFIQPQPKPAAVAEPSEEPAFREDETRWLEGIRERLLVLFEGFQSPNNVQIEAKVDLTLNFLEYLLATIDSRLDHLKHP